MMMKNQIKIIFPVLIMGFLLLNFASCKRYYDPPPYFEPEGDTTKPALRKVLLIAIDGAVPSEYKTMALPVLEELKAHSKYSWDAFTAENSSDASAWKTLLTGISYTKHGIKDSSFMYIQDQNDHEHDIVASYPSMFSYILSSAKPDMKTSLITPWSNITQILAPEVADPVLAIDDKAVKDSALTRIKAEKIDFITVNFNSLSAAGKQFGFSASATGYKEAATKIDGYIGELMAALKARPGYNKQEEWLVIITSTHGGDGFSYGGESPKETTGFAFYYNEKLKPTELTKEGTFSGVLFKGKDATAVRAVLDDNGSNYNVGTDDQTIQLRIKGSAGAYPHFFSKMEKFVGAGWSMFTGGSSWAISVKSPSSGEKRIQPGSPNVFDKQWHTITVVFVDSASKWWVRRYTDGVRHDLTEITAFKTTGGVTSPSPLTLGWGTDKAYTSAEINVADVSIFNTALSDEEIKDNLCLSDITKHPKYANLIGFWPCSEGFGDRLNNLVSGKPAFKVLGPYSWLGVPDMPCSMAPLTDPGKRNLHVKNVDVLANVFYWLKLPVNSSWGIDGNKWLESYEIEFIKL